MTLNSLLNSIAIIGLNDKLVNWAGGGPSVYQAANALTVKDYPFLFCSPTGTHRVEENWTTYNVTIFYVSRLLEDNSNEMDIQSTAVEVIKNIVKKIQNTDGVISVSDEYTINVFVEYEKFADRTTGAFATLEISIANDTTCTVDEEHYFVFDNLPGEMLPADSNKYYISWRTDYPAINYTFVLPNGEIVNGYTEEHSIVVSFPENTDRVDKTLTFIAFVDGEVGRLEWYQESVEFFEFVTEDNQLLRADTTGFTVVWATNIEGEIEYAVTLNGADYESGTTSGDSITVHMDRNDWRDRINEFEISISIGGTLMGTLQWKQDKPIFNILAGRNVVLPAEATAATVTWETTYPWVGWGLHSYVTGEDLDEGTTSGTTLTVSFPENTDTQNQSFYTVGFWSPSGEPLNSAEIRQNPAEPVEYYFNFITETGQVLSAATTAFTVTWEMNYPDPAVQYRLYDGTEMIALGNTTGTTATVSFPENLTTDRKQYVFEAWNYNGGLRYGQLVFYQEALPLPVYYFRITSEDGQTVPANATAFTINYETNIEPPLHYVYTSPFGVYEGDSWNQSSVTITFSANESTAVQERRVEIGGEVITWYQAAAAYEFEFLNTEGITVPAATTAYTVEWLTNLDSIGYKFYNGNILVTSGNTSATAMTVTFAENESTTSTNPLRFEAYANNTLLGTLHWTQDKAETEPGDYEREYLTFDIISGGTVFCTKAGSSTFPSRLSYRKGNGNWTTLAQNEAISVTAGEQVEWKANGALKFVTDTKFNVYGNAYSIIYEDNFYGIGTLGNMLSHLFEGCTGLISAENMVLPATALTISSVYYSMFEGCTSLVNAPVLPAATLSTQCYARMFRGCTGLVTAPALPATTLANDCYVFMFYGCTALVNAPALPATTVVWHCYSEMFARCTSLVNAPVLPAVQLAEQCYGNMFSRCTALRRIECYADPESYEQSAFYGPTGTWVYGVPAGGIFIKKAGTNWTNGASGIPNGWTVIEK